MSEWVKVVIQGVVQGFTEFLPISSTGHLLVFSALLEFEESMGGTFEIFIQIGTLVAVIIFFRHSLWQQVTTFRSDPSVQRLWFNVFVASLPMGILGILFVDFITEQVFPQDTAPLVIAITLILGGFVFLWVESRPDPSERETTDHLTEITPKQAIIVGFAQTLALIPGTSRSGASIVGGLLVGMDRRTATEFSFYLAIPVLGGATVIQLLSKLDEIDPSGLFTLIFGAVIAGVVAWFTIGWLLRFVARHDFVIFGYYRIITGCLLLILILLNVL